MHEFHIVDNIMENVLNATKDKEYKKLVSINIMLGQESHIKEENLKQLLEIKFQDLNISQPLINVTIIPGSKVYLDSVDVD